MQGEALSGAFRWERDVLRLERVVLEQRHSRYEVQGDYAIPAGAPLPRTAASLALPPTIGGSAAGSVAASQPLENEFDPSSGRWRIQVCNFWAPTPLYHTLRNLPGFPALQLG